MSPQVPQVDAVVLENVELIFRNFEGKETQYNRAGTKNFGVLLSEEAAQSLAAAGWNVKVLKAREDDEESEERPWLPVAIRFDVFPPRVVLVTSRGRTNLDETSIEMLDWADIVNVDLIVRPYSYDVNNKIGIKAYVKTMFVTINEDPLEAKYAELET